MELLQNIFGYFLLIVITATYIREILPVLGNKWEDNSKD